MAEEEKKGLFREEAVKSHATDVNLGMMMVIVSPKHWIALWSIGGLFVILVLWAIAGSIPDNVAGQGFVLRREGNFVISAEEEGQLEQLYVQEGENVVEGQLLAVMKNEFFDLALQELNKNKQMIMAQLFDYKTQHYQYVKAKRQAILEAIATNEEEIIRIEQELDFLVKELQWQRELHEEGLISLPQINDTQIKINGQKNYIKESKTSIQNARAELKQLEDVLQIQSFHTRLEEVESQIQESSLRKEKLKIHSPFSGTILSIPVGNKDTVSKGETIVWGERSSLDADNKQHHVIYAYFDSDKDQFIKPGMIAQIRLNDVNYKKYGDLLALVKFVWQFPSSSEEIYKVIGNKEMVSTVTKGGSVAPMQVVLEPIVDKNNISGYKWTSEQGPPFNIRSGVMGTVQIVIREKHPIEFVFPIYRTVKNSITLTKVQKEELEIEEAQAEINKEKLKLQKSTEDQKKAQDKKSKKNKKDKKLQKETTK